jgi:hypothetical protein
MSAPTGGGSIPTHEDVAAAYPKIWSILPIWLVERHRPDELLELIETVYIALPHRLVRRATRLLVDGDLRRALDILSNLVLPRLLDEPNEGEVDDLHDLDADEDFSSTPSDPRGHDEIAQVQAGYRWVWCIRRGGVEVVRGVSRRELSDVQLAAIRHLFTTNEISP